MTICLIHKFVSQNGDVFCERCGKATSCKHKWKVLDTILVYSDILHVAQKLTSYKKITLQCAICGELKLFTTED